MSQMTHLQEEDPENSGQAAFVFFLNIACLAVSTVEAYPGLLPHMLHCPLC
jgi:hypothetical protein